MKRRIRKKLHKGEFKQFGFKVRFSPRENLSVHHKDLLWDRFIMEAIEAFNLSFGGGSFDGFTEIPTSNSAPENARIFVEQWLQSQEEIAEFFVGNLTDAWYGPFD